MDYSYIKSQKEFCLGTFVCIPGLAHTKDHFLKTPDGRDGWAINLSEIGFDVYCLNWHNLDSKNSEFDSCFVINSISNFIENIVNKDVFLLTHSASGAFGWKIAEKTNLVKKIIAIAPAPPGNIQEIPNSQISQDNKNISILHLNAVPYNFSLEKNWEADIDWVKQKAIGEHTLHFPNAFLSEYHSSLVSVPSLVLYERMNIQGSQVKIDVEKLKENNPSIYIFTGDKDISHSYEIDKKISNYFLENKINSTFFWLADFNFTGNGHMLMLQNNSKEILDFIVSKILN
jgi:hypothetical protein